MSKDTTKTLNKVVQIDEGRMQSIWVSWCAAPVERWILRAWRGELKKTLAERMLDKVAAAVHRDPLDVRLANLYGENERAITPYGMKIEDNVLPQLMTELAGSSDYRARRAAIVEGNIAAGRSPIRRGIALTPVRFGISFTTSFLNQAGALIHIYKDEIGRAHV